MNLRRLLSICCVWALCLGGCLGRGEIIPLRYYGIDSLAATVPPSTRTWPVALGVRPYTAATRYRDRILYRTSAVEFAFYPYDRWVEPPEEMVTRLVSHMVRASGLFPQVVSAYNVQLPAWILSGEVTRFDEVREAGGRRAECWLSRAPTVRALLRSAVRHERPGQRCCTCRRGSFTPSGSPSFE